MKYPWLLIVLISIYVEPINAYERTAEMYDQDYVMDQSPSYKRWYALRGDSDNYFTQCHIAIDAARDDDPYMGEIAWNCYKSKQHRYDVTFNEAYQWLQLSYSINTPGSAEAIGDLYRDGFLDQKPDYNKAISYYETSRRWLHTASQGFKVFSDNSLLERKLLSLKRSIDCANAEVELFDIKIKCVLKTDLETALSKYNLPVIKADTEKRNWYYNSQVITGIPSVLIVRYSPDNRIANLEYAFQARKGDNKYYYKLLESLVEKYGASENNVQYQKAIRIRSNAEWRLNSGLSIRYHSNKGVQPTITYFNPYPSKLRYWENKRKNKHGTEQIASPTKEKAPMDLSGF